jgi:hypothetical protein
MIETKPMCWQTLTVLVAALIFSRLAPVAIAAGQAAAPGCSVSIAAAQYPELLPPYLVWEQVFDALLSSRALPPLDGDDVGRATARARAAMQRVTSVRSDATRDADERRAEESDVVLAARDDLIRILTPTSFSALERAGAALSTDLTVKTPAVGRRQGRGGLSECRVVITGREHPEMVPEAGFWSLYLMGRGAASAPFREAPGHHQADHVNAVHDELPIPTEDIERLLAAAEEFADTVNALPDSIAKDSLVRDLAMSARANLVRSFPEIVWLQIQKDASRARSAMRIGFPSR